MAIGDFFVCLFFLFFFFVVLFCVFFFFQAEDGIRDLVRSRGLGDVYKRQDMNLWKKEVWLTLANQSFDPHKKYQLIVRDTEDQLLSLIHI